MERLEEKASNFFVCVESPHGCSNVVIKNNYAGGADFTGFMAPANECSGSTGVTMEGGNYVSSSMVGWRYTNPGSKGGTACAAHSYPFTIFKAEGGVMSKTGITSVTISKLVIVDTIDAVSIVNGMTNGGHTEVTDSLIIGRSLHSYCDPTSCSSDECASRHGTILGSFRQEDESVTLLGKIKTPMDNPKTEQSWDGDMKWTNLAYVNFNPQTNCSTKDFSIHTNSKVTDKYAINTFSQIKLKNVDLDNSVIYFKPLPDSNIVVELCGWFQCSAENNVIAHSEDGTLFKLWDSQTIVRPGIFIPPNLDKADKDICD